MSSTAVVKKTGEEQAQTAQFVSTGSGGSRPHFLPQKKTVHEGGSGQL
jgi:hypothetical protein